MSVKYRQAATQEKSDRINRINGMVGLRSVKIVARSASHPVNPVNPVKREARSWRIVVQRPQWNLASVSSSAVENMRDID